MYGFSTMLLHHFGSREGLLAAVTVAVEEAERATLRGAGAIGADDAQRFWARYSDPGLWPQERLFFEMYVHALRGRPGTEGFLEHVVTGWLEPLTAALAQGGTDPRIARAAARLSMAVTRGLLLDLLATRDTEGVTAAFELFVQLGAAAPPSREPRLPKVLKIERPDVMAGRVQVLAAGQAPGAAYRLVAVAADPEPGRVVPAVDAELDGVRY
jgi:AcrR family transcriptional regulator